MEDKSFWDKTIPEIENKHERRAAIIIIMPLFIVASLSCALINAVFDLVNVVYEAW